jgi:hypothetical protein
MTAPTDSPPRTAAPTAREEFQWNQPAYLLDSRLWMTGYDAGSGMIKLPYDKELPVDVLTLLMRARLDE